MMEEIDVEELHQAVADLEQEGADIEYSIGETTDPDEIESLQYDLDDIIEQMEELTEMIMEAEG